MFDDLNAIQAARAATMKSAATGMTAYQLALVCNRIRPGIDFRGMGKKELYRDFASGFLCSVKGRELRGAISEFHKG